MKLLLTTVLAAMLAACAGAPPDTSSAVAAGGLIDADSGAQRVRADFDALTGRVRFLTILSPT
jgi:hypothetical protein